MWKSNRGNDFKLTNNLKPKQNYAEKSEKKAFHGGNVAL